jgi:hypothetical protein
MQKFVNYRLRLVIIGDISGTWRPVRPFAPSSTSRTGPTACGSSPTSTRSTPGCAPSLERPDRCPADHPRRDQVIAQFGRPDSDGVAADLRDYVADRVVDHLGATQRGGRSREQLNGLPDDRYRMPGGTRARGSGAHGPWQTAGPQRFA